MSSISDITLVIKVISDTSQMDKLTTGMRRFESQADRVRQANTRLGKSTGIIEGHFAGLSSKLNIAERKMDAVFRAGIHLQAMGRDLIGVGRNIAGFAADVVSTYADYDFVLRQTALALNTNVEWQGKLDKAIQQTAIQLGKFTPKEVAQAYRIWGAATGDVVESQEDLARITKTVSEIMMATAMVGGSLESNLQGVYGVTQQYGLGIEKAGYVTRILSLLTERTALNFGDLTSAFVYAGSYTGAIGAKFEDVAQALGVMADAGFRGSKAGRGLSMFFEGITAPSGPAKKALDRLAKSMGAVSWKKWVFPKGKFEGMRDLIEKMAKGLEKMTPVQRAQFLAQAGSNNAVRAAIPLINQQILLWQKQRKAGQDLTSVLDEQKYSLKTAGAFFESMSASFLESFDAIIGGFKNSFFPVIQMIAIEIMKFAGPIMKKVQNFLKQFIAWMEKNPAVVEMAVKIGAVVAVISALAGALLLALGTMAFFYSNLILVTAGFVPLVTMFAGLALAITTFVAKVASNTGGITDALAHLATSIGRIFDILLEGKGAGTIFMEIAAAINSLLNTGFEVLATVIEAIADALDQLTPEQVRMVRDIGAAFLALVALNTGLGILSTLIGGLALKITSFGVAGAGALSLLGRAVLALTGNLLPLFMSVRMLAGGLLVLLGAITPIGAALLVIGALIGAAILAYETNFMGFRDFVNGIISWLTVNLPGAIDAALTAIGGLIAGVISPITENLPKIKAFFEGILTSLSEAWGPVLEHLGMVASEVFGNIVAAFQQVVDNIMPHIQPLVDEIMKLVSSLVDALGPAWNAIVVIVGAAVGAIIKLIVTLVNAIAPIIQGLADFLLRVWGIIGEFIIRTVGNFVTAVIDNIKGFVSIIRGIIDFFSSALKGDWNGMWKALETIVRGFAGIVENIIRFFVTLIGDIIRAGLQAVSGIFEFIFGMKPGSILATIGGFITTFLKNIGKFISDVVAGVGKLPDKMINIGKDVVYGLWEGIKSMIKWLADKVTGFINSVIPGPIRDALGISSPSKVMAAIGVNIVEGLAQGIMDTSDAYDAMVAQANAISKVATGTFDSATLGLSPVSLSSTNDATRTVNLNVDVTSADGSVSALDMSVLSDLITGSDMVRALERMASVD